MGEEMTQKDEELKHVEDIDSLLLRRLRPIPLNSKSLGKSDLAAATRQITLCG